MEEVFGSAGLGGPNKDGTFEPRDKWERYMSVAIVIGAKDNKN